MRPTRPMAVAPFAVVLGFGTVAGARAGQPERTRAVFTRLSGVAPIRRS